MHENLFISNGNKKSLAYKTKITELPFFRPLNQPKLRINQPNDIYEQEANAMADKVMRMHAPSLKQDTFFKPAIIPVQRKCAHCEEEEKKMQRKEMRNDVTIANT